LPCKAGKTKGRVLLPPVIALGHRSGKITNALATALSHHVLPPFVRSCPSDKCYQKTTIPKTYIDTVIRCTMQALCTASAKKLRVKTDKTRRPVRLEGHSVFLPRAIGMSVWGKIMQPVVLSVLQGKGRSAEKPLC
jgi:hypothetical protein